MSGRFLSMIVLTALVYFPVPAQSQSSRTAKPRFYVWDFKTNLTGEDRIRAQQLTEEFETVLIQSGQYDVLERRTLASVLKQHEDEVGLIERLSPADRRELQFRKADGVIFGDVFHDLRAGEVNVSISFQFFDSRKPWSDRKSCLYRDLFSQADRMKLARSLLPAAPVSEGSFRPQEATGKHVKASSRHLNMLFAIPDGWQRMPEENDQSLTLMPTENRMRAFEQKPLIRLFPPRRSSGDLENDLQMLLNASGKPYKQPQSHTDPETGRTYAIIAAEYSYGYPMLVVGTVVGSNVETVAFLAKQNQYDQFFPDFEFFLNSLTFASDSTSR